MSIDFMVFDPAVAPRDHRDFRVWYRIQTDWPDEGDVGPSVASPPIQRWYAAMCEDFPDSNGEIDPRATTVRHGDYNFSIHACYVAFHHSVADEAWKAVDKLAATHGLGIYDPNSDDERSGRSIRFP